MKKIIKQKILIGSIFVALLMVSMPFVSALHAQPLQEKSINMNVVLNPIEQLIVQLQYAVDNQLKGVIDEDLVQELQNNINNLEYPPLICISLFAIFVILAGALMYPLAMLVLFVALLWGCPWAWIIITPPENNTCELCEDASDYVLT